MNIWALQMEVNSHGCVWGSAASGSGGWWRVFTDVVILSCDRQDHSISQRRLGSGKQYTHIPILLGRRRQPSQI